jgi:hypothetical protein
MAIPTVEFFEDLPAASSYGGKIYQVTDTDENSRGYYLSDGSDWFPAVTHNDEIRAIMQVQQDDLDTALSGKVDKVTGSALSENDFTDTLKSKLDALPDNSALEARLVVLENWKTATGIKRIERFNSTTNGSGDITLTFGTAVSNVSKVGFTIDGVYAGTDHPLMASVRSLSTTGATIRVYRNVTLLVLGSTVATVSSQAVNISMIEFE